MNPFGSKVFNLFAFILIAGTLTMELVNFNQTKRLTKRVNSTYESLNTNIKNIRLKNTSPTDNSDIKMSTAELFSAGMGYTPSNLQCDYISRYDFIKLIDTSKSVLEIGPFANPSITGNNVKYFDVLDRKGLIDSNAKHGFGLDISKIPNIDYVESKGDLSVIKEKFDIVFSSHNIEHQVNLIKHLQQSSNL